MTRDFVNLADFTGAQLSSLLDRARADKALLLRGELPATLAGKVLAMIFEKPSLRTRVSFETGMIQLGGAAIYLAPADIGLGKREPVRDVARVLSRMCDGIMARTFSHELMCELAEWADVPVINGLTDFSHPCQAMADLMTVREHLGRLEGLKLAFVGDGNNVARSLAVACGKLGVRFALAAPDGYQLDEAFVTGLEAGAFSQSSDPREAVRDANVLYTDTWTSMGQEEDRQRRVKDFAGFQLNTELVSQAAEGAIVLHCLPAYRGLEITDEVFETHAEEILDEAENRLHFQRSLLTVLMGEGGIA